MDSELIGLQLLKTDALKYIQQQKQLSSVFQQINHPHFVLLIYFSFSFSDFFPKYFLIVCITQKNIVSIAIYSTHNHTTCKTNYSLFFLAQKFHSIFELAVATTTSNKSISWHKITCNLTFVPQFPGSV